MAIVKIERKQLYVIIISIMLATISYFIPVAETHTRAAAVPGAEHLPKPVLEVDPEPVTSTRRALVALPEEKPVAPPSGQKTGEAAAITHARPAPSIERLTARDFLPAPGTQLSQDTPVISITQDRPLGFRSPVRY
jgi:hypothetical protein